MNIGYQQYMLICACTKFPSIDFARRIEEFPEHQHDDELCTNTATAVTDIVVQTRSIVHSARASIVRNVITNKQEECIF